MDLSKLFSRENLDILQYLAGNNSINKPKEEELSKFNNLRLENTPEEDVVEENQDDFLKSLFGDKGVFQGVSSTLSGLGNLYLGYQTLKNAKKQQAFSNAAMTHQMNTQTKMINDQYDQRSQSHAASKGLEGQERDRYVSEQNKKSQLNEFRR